MHGFPSDPGTIDRLALNVRHEQPIRWAELLAECQGNEETALGVLHDEIKRKLVAFGHVSWHVLACKRHPVRKLLKLLPVKYIEALEQNQQIAHCCRHPENHEISAFKSNAYEIAPDIYIFHCGCGRNHTRFCVGGGDVRPMWDVR